MVPPRGARLWLHFIGVSIPYGLSEAYSSAETAERALDMVLQATGLPRPCRVNCGDGLEIYWPLATSVGTALWRPVARALRGACEGAGLVADHETTVDPLSLWRVVGTHNRAVDPPALVTLIDEGEGPHELRDLHDRLRRARPSGTG
jgi:hypothetical protein